ncbi:hypothetical protein [Paenibacillus lentus]|uniref:hypothetical protein n=1 Tax=Paenibacillus lentus TaxID=1338368 RepID=UPI0013DE4595|nr:hypothetical protein [Paenibacillus lentus]
MGLFVTARLKMGSSFTGECRFRLREDVRFVTGGYPLRYWRISTSLRENIR